MSIKEVNGNSYQLLPTNAKGGKVEAKQKVTPKDKVQLSGKAKALYEAEQSQRVEDIRAKVKDGFYLRRDVTEKVAEKILMDIKNASAK